MSQAARSDIEIIERRKEGAPLRLNAILPNEVRINGTEVLVTEDVIIHPLVESDVATVTMTFIVTSLSVRAEPE